MNKAYNYIPYYPSLFSKPLLPGKIVSVEIELFKTIKSAVDKQVLLVAGSFWIGYCASFVYASPLNN